MSKFTTTGLDVTRDEIRATFRKWGIDPSEWEIVWDESKEGVRLPGARVRYMRSGKWQEIICTAFPSRAQNLRQCYLLLDRLRIAEQNGVQYMGLTFTTDVASVNQEASRKESLLEAYDILGVSPDDPLDLVKSVYRSKSLYYHPDKNPGEQEKQKRLNLAYETVMKSRGQK